MGSRPSKVAPVRSRSGLSFVSTSSIDSHSTIGSTYEPGEDGFNTLGSLSFQQALL